MSCGSLSSLEATRQCVNSLLLGDSSLSLVIGAENPSNYPFYLPESRRVNNLPDSPIKDPIESHFTHSLPQYIDPRSMGFSDVHNHKKIKKNFPISMFSEAHTKSFKISRKHLDAESLGSMLKLINATNKEILNIIPSSKNETIAEKLFDPLDKYYKWSSNVSQKTTKSQKITSMHFDEQLQYFCEFGFQEIPMFSRPVPSICSTAHFPRLASGACAMLLGSDLDSSSSPLCKIVDFSFQARPASKYEIQVFSILTDFVAKNALSLHDIDFLEIHENSATLLTVLKKFIPEHEAKINRLGGALATGLVQGAVGTQLLLNAASQLKAKGHGNAVVLVASENGDFGMFLLNRTF